MRNCPDLHVRTPQGLTGRTCLHPVWPSWTAARREHSCGAWWSGSPAPLHLRNLPVWPEWPGGVLPAVQNHAVTELVSLPKEEVGV